ncbi:unnamed protein product [Protopolystoma xenopodis]|uniref:Uncharacterized protein n=1 Tax=Protopolystoma xenopodis TaxID=117903 RepID=A0A448XH51_9PLAT|nr:unnamed protein product [Protopolystoma xenopodis]
MSPLTPKCPKSNVPFTVTHPTTTQTLLLPVTDAWPYRFHLWMDVQFNLLTLCTTLFPLFACLMFFRPLSSSHTGLAILSCPLVRNGPRAARLNRGCGSVWGQCFFSSPRITVEISSEHIT